ncbi:MAG: hypothetical protein Q9219_000121 [cf. Caloplaca sp. 3 TL-2023]
MQTKKALLAAVAAALLSDQGHGQKLFDSQNPDGNETIYGPLKVIDIPHYPMKFRPYPKIDPETRETLHNGGIEPMCGSCNSTGCLCPEMPDDHGVHFNGLCEGCRTMDAGGLRCYCSPALDASPCNATRDLLTACNDQPDQCKDALALYFCEPQQWDQNPGLKKLATPSVVYGIQTATIMPPGLDSYPTVSWHGPTLPIQESQKIQASGGSAVGVKKSVIVAAVAAALVSGLCVVKS